MAFLRRFLSPLIVDLSKKRYSFAPLSALREYSSESSSASAADQKKMDELAKNPYYAKYAAKIAAIEKDSPDTLKSKLEELKAQKAPQSASNEPLAPAPASKPKESVSSYAFSKKKVLNDVMKTELLQDKSAEEIGEIWLNYFKDKDAISAVIPESAYKIVEQRAIDFPTFVFPLPRDSGYEFMLCQFASNECHLTSLINYQTYKENAPECLTIVYYDDLKEKGLVLMKGEYNKDVLNPKEAQCLANLVHVFYGKDEGGAKLELLRRFTHEAKDFDVMDIVNETNNLQL